ncbi:hypothetical protein BC629DRAFT_1586560 [Irpex lacteus]|nr:hypothetical protein BC629DRAFT_1586560 [Irpex lacteus]
MMAVFTSFFAVVSMVFQLVSLPTGFSDMYHLALARVESVVCSPNVLALSPYLEVVCNSLDAYKPLVTPSVIYDFNTSSDASFIHPGHLGVSVFGLSGFSFGSLVNCTLVDVAKPEVIYFGPDVFFGPQYSRELIVAPKFGLLPPPPVPQVNNPTPAPSVEPTPDVELNSTSSPMVDGQGEQSQGSSSARWDFFKTVLDYLVRYAIEGLIYYGIWRAIDGGAKLYRHRLGLPSHSDPSLAPPPERREPTATPSSPATPASHPT